MRLFYIFSLLIISVCANAQANASSSAIVQTSAESFVCKAININTTEQEFSPFLFNGTLYFTSNKRKFSAINYTSYDTVVAHTDIYECKKIDSINFKSVKKIKEINSLNHDGPLSVNKSGTQILFSSCDKNNKFFIQPSITNRKLQIYTSNHQNNKWSKPKAHPLNNANYSICHPVFANSDSIIVFCSDMPGGYGKMDLYYSVLKNATWSKPINFGNKINTAENELFPFVSASNLLYFSSKSTTGNDLDIYEFELSDSTKSLKHASKKPINSEFDDFGIWTNEANNKGYFSSNRNVGNSDDVFYFEDAIPEFKNCVPSKEKFCYTFFEESTKDADTTETIYEWDLGDGTKKRGIEAKHCYHKTGTYQVQLNVIEKASNQLFYNELSYDFVVEDLSPLAIKLPAEIIKNKSIEFDASNTHIKNHTIQSYYWINSSEVIPTVKANFVFENRGVKTIKLGVVAKNDSTKGIEKFCVEKSFFVTDTLGEETGKPELTKLSNSNYNGLPHDSLKYRVNLGVSKDSISANSTIFKGIDKLDIIKEDSMYRYTSGNESSLKQILPYYKFAKEKGFSDAIVVGFKLDEIVKGQEKNANYELIDTTSIGENKCVVYFEYDNPLVLKKYDSEIKLIAEKIKLKKDKKVTLVNYFDGIGKLEYNIVLNNKRVENLVKLLKQNKVNTNNLYIERIYFTKQNVSPDLLRRIEIKIIN